MNGLLNRVKLLIAQLVDANILDAVAVILVTAGLVGITVELSWYCFPAAFYGGRLDPSSKPVAIGAVCCLAVGLILGAIVLIQAAKAQQGVIIDDKKRYSQCLKGICFVLLLDALINVVALAGFAKAGAVPYLFYPGSTNLLHSGGSTVDTNNAASKVKPINPGTNNPAVPQSVTHSNTAASSASAEAAAETTPGESGSKPSSQILTQSNSAATLASAEPPAKGKAGESAKKPTLTRKGIEDSNVQQELTGEQKHLVTMIQVLLALGFTIMGAMFFFAKSLWEKMRAPQIEPFDDQIFWAGLWFRLAGATVFTIVVYLSLLFISKTEVTGWMPLIALILGLNVKSAENLVAGISKRLLDAVDAFIK